MNASNNPPRLRSTRHFRLICWRLLYRFDVQKPLDRLDEIVACVHGRMPLAQWDAEKARCPREWQKLLAKRQRRLEWLQTNGSVPDGWTPPDPADPRRTANKPIGAYLARRFMTEDGLIFSTQRGRKAPSLVVIERVLAWKNQNSV